jgi:16S rRNA (adenine1518-N6/adenine1519-N6)-dimethyltransferase
MRTRKRFGQHFLEPAWADKVASAIAPSSGDAFLEIGPGPGILTLRLAASARQVVAVEIDRDLVASLRPKLPPNAAVVAGDVLDIDLDGVLSAAPVEGALRIAGNLPYNISSPIIFRLLDLAARRAVKDATLMLQREVADRIAATPGTSEYGVLSVLVQWRADVMRLLAIPPGAFRPPPQVRSALIRLDFRPPPFELRDSLLFERMVRRMFTQRRKTLGNALAAFAAESGLRSDDVLAQAGVDPRRRPETLEVIEIARLADLFATANH